jgi:hypothetical protein
MTAYKESLSLPCVVLALCLSLVGSTAADSFFKQVTHTDAVEFMGETQPASDDTTVIWIGQGRSFSSSGDTASIICRLEENALYMLDHVRHQYSRMPLTFEEMMEEASGEQDDAAAKMAEAMQQMVEAMLGEATVSVTPTDQKRAINSWQTRRFLVSLEMAFMKMDMDIWSTEDIHTDPTLYQAVTSQVFGQMQGMEMIQSEMAKVKGVPVLTKCTVEAFGVPLRSETRLIEYAEKEAPDRLYDIPRDYVEVAFGMTED